MAKERFLTVLVPIKDSDCESGTYTVQTLPAASASNINKIYKMTDGTYRRSWFNPASGQSGAYEYATVTDREFPYLGDPLEIYDFTYDATRMGTAPTISAQGVMRFADSNGNTLDGLFLQNWQECHVVFNGENFYLKQIPTSKKDNEDARYRYDMDFVSERVVLEGVYFYDIVSPFITKKPISEQSTFPFFGDAQALADRINASLIRSGLAWLTEIWAHYPDTPTKDVPHLTYEQWNRIPLDDLSLIDEGVFENYDELVDFDYQIYGGTNGDYNTYLRWYVYETDQQGNFIVSGYQVKMGLDEKGEQVTSEEKRIDFQNNTIYEALQEFYDTFELQYYIVKEKSLNGEFTGNTNIVVADCEYDFADRDNGIIVRDDDGIPTTEHPFDYGVEDALLSKEKTNTTEKIVTRITGVGSSENIPWYYPNPNPDGWIKPTLKTAGVAQNVMIDYPTEEGSTPSEMVRYEKYQKNRIGNNFQYGKIAEYIYADNTSSSPKIEDVVIGGITGKKIVADYLHVVETYALLTTEPDDWATNYSNYYKKTPRNQYIALTSAETFAENTYYYKIEFSPQKLTMVLNLLTVGSNCGEFTIQRLENNAVVETYNSNTNPNTTPFEKLCHDRNGSNYIDFTKGIHSLRFNFFLSSLPYSKQYDFEGYLYVHTTVSYTIRLTEPNHYFYGGYGNVRTISATTKVNFYEQDGLYPYVAYHENIDHVGDIYYHEVFIDGAGYSTVPQTYTLYNPAPIVPRIENKKYKDLSPNGKIYKCTTSSDEPSYNVFYENPPMSAKEWLDTFVNLKLSLYDFDSWYLKQKAVQLADYGMNIDNPNYTPDIFDTIEFSRLKYITPQPTLMPEIYIKTDGERRFYNAHNYYPLQEVPSTGIDAASGEMVETIDDVDYVINPIYKEEITDPDDKHYDFENEYLQALPHEHIENFDDVKPTIKGQTNTVGDVTFRIDVVEEFAYDVYDDDDIWENNDNGSVQGEYKHPYFFAKLRPMGFNLFDLALQEDMVLSMTTGDCGACQFKIGVDEKTGKNPVQIWQHDVYNNADLSPTHKVYSEGDLMRYVNTEGLYYDVDGNPVPVTKDSAIIEGGFLVGSSGLYIRYNYSGESVQNGEVGTMKKDGNCHFEGDVITNGRFIDKQQDTSNDYVWVALMKDTDTYGTIMPSTRPNYNDTNYNVYIRPKAVADVQEEDDADKFVLLNIKLPQVYLRRAECALSRKLVAYMNDNNYQKFNFAVKFSRIFIADNTAVDDNLNENSVLYVKYNQGIYRQYVKHYTYRMSHEEALPEISVDMNEELSVSRTFRQQEKVMQRRSNTQISSRLNALALQIQGRVDKTKMDKSDDVVMSGNIIIDGRGTSLREIINGDSGGGTVTQALQWGYF